MKGINTVNFIKAKVSTLGNFSDETIFRHGFVSLFPRTSLWSNNVELSTTHLYYRAFIFNFHVFDTFSSSANSYN